MRGWRWLAAALLMLLAAASGGAWAVREALAPLPPGPEVEVTIPPGSLVRDIGQALETAGIVKRADVFNFYVRWKYREESKHFQAGVYRLHPGMTIDEVVQKIVSGDVYRETVTFTVPEGFTVEQIADRLAKEGLVEREAFLREVNEGDFDFRYFQYIPAAPDRKFRLEGYLFPDTYTVEKGATAHDIIQRMLTRFESVFSEEWRKQAATLGLTMDQAVTLASIVEREAVLDEERPRIAGVFYNRLQAKWRLESCATVEYVLDEHKERLTLQDLAVEDPYNTYLHDGLPPGPIANPGKKSLEAVLWPEKHDYFFFVAKNDGSGGHYFSKTYEEHLKHNAKSSGSF